LATLFWLSILFIIYTYFGYPIIISFLAKIKNKASSFPETIPYVTFLIAAYNEEAFIAKKLENTLALDYPRDKLQILVAADGSSDRTPDIVREYGSQKIELSYIADRGGKMAAITRAMSLARGDVVIMSDANNVYDQQAIRLLVAPFTDKTVGMTTGAKLIVESGENLSSAEGLYWKYESSIKTNETILGSCTSAVGEIMAVRKELFLPSEQKIVLDDLYLALTVIRQGYRVIYVPSARSYEYVSQSAKDEFDRRLKINAGLFQTISISGRLLPFDKPFIVWQIVSHKLFRPFIPFAMILALASNIVVVFLDTNVREASLWTLSPPYGWILLSLQLTFYVAAILGNVFNIKGFVGKILYLPTFLVNSNLASAAGLHNYLTNKQPHLWKRVRR
jgi:poly-beta-1,6-N-acetyl-D-glucosamine synthase